MNPSSVLRTWAIPLLAAVLSATTWISVAPLLFSPTQGAGLSFTDASIGTVLGFALLLVVTIIIGAATWATSPPTRSTLTILAGPVALGFISGPITGWFARSGSAIPQRYGRLFLEVLFLQTMLIVVIIAIQYLAPRVAVRLKIPYVRTLKSYKIVTVALFRSIGPALLASVLSGVIACFLIRNPDMGQVGWGLFLSFLLGSLIGGLILPSEQHLAPTLTTPALVGAVGYAIPMLSYAESNRFLHDWYAGRLMGLALAMPIHYVAFGTLGAVIGFYFARGLVTHAPANTENEKPR